MTRTTDHHPASDGESPTTAPELISGKEEAESAEWHLRVPRDLLYLRGHFTDRPIVPGIVLVHWVVGQMEGWQGVSLQINSIEALKFHNFLFPGQRFTMRILRGGGRWRFDINSGELKIASGRIVEREDAVAKTAERHDRDANPPGKGQV